MKISILKKEISDRVKAATFYAAEGVKPEKGDVAAMAQLSDDDGDVFEDLLSDAATEVNAVVMGMWSSSNFVIEDDAVAFEVYPPYSWVRNMDGELKRAVMDFMAHRITERWLAVFGIPAVNRAEELKMDIRIILSRREKPL